MSESIGTTRTFDALRDEGVGLVAVAQDAVLADAPREHSAIVCALTSVGEVH